MHIEVNGRDVSENVRERLKKRQAGVGGRGDDRGRVDGKAGAGEEEF